MANNVKKCPHCGNYVEGKRANSFGRKMGKTAAKGVGGEVAVDAMKYGAAATGAAIGSIIPGIGTLIGGGVGYLVGLAGKTALNDGIDKGVDALSDAEYVYTCPRCGHEF